MHSMELTPRNILKALFASSSAGREINSTATGVLAGPGTNTAEDDRQRGGVEHLYGKFVPFMEVF